MHLIYVLAVAHCNLALASHRQVSIIKRATDKKKVKTSSYIHPPSTSRSSKPAVKKTNVGDSRASLNVNTYEYEGRSINYYVVLTQPRSGSTYFVSLLASHPCIDNAGEMITIGRGNISDPSVYIKELVKKMKPLKSCPEANISLGSKNMLFKDASIPGLNNKFLDFSSKNAVKRIGTYLSTRNIRVILLLRRNVLESMVSMLYHGKPQHCTSTSVKCDKVSPQHSLIITENDFKRFYYKHVAVQNSAIENMTQVSRNYSVPVLYVPYEQLLDNKEDTTMDSVLRFLGYAYNRTTTDLTSIFVKRVNEEISSVITNYRKLLPLVEKLCPEYNFSAPTALDRLPPSDREIRLLV